MEQGSIKKGNDYIVRAMSKNGHIRGIAAITTDMVNLAQKTHDLYPVPCAALGRLLTAATLMSQFLKNEKDTLTLQVKGDGPLGGMIVVSDSHANVRGYVNQPRVDLPLNPKGKLDVGGAVGRNGYLNVIKDIGLKEPYVGYVPLVSGEIAEDLTLYFARSEQIPSAIALGVLVAPDLSALAAGGYILQLMPDAPEEAISQLEQKVAEAKPITTMIHEGMSPEDILKYFLDDIGDITTAECEYRCNCSRDRMFSALVSIGRKDIEEIISEQGGAELECHFCTTKYAFNKTELEQIISEQSSK